MQSPSQLNEESSRLSSAPIDNSALVSSYLFSPLVLGIIRITIGLYTLGCIVADLAVDATLNNTATSYFSYFTHLSLIGLCAYFIAAAVQTFWFWHRSDGTYPLADSWPRIFMILHMVLISTIVTFPILTTIVFWTLLSDPDSLSTPYNAWATISTHALNAVYALFEILLTNLRPMPWIHVVVCFFLLLGYLGVAYITHADQGFYVYPFLNPSKQGSLLAAYIVGIAVGEILIFVIVRFIIVLRVRLVEGPQPKSTPTTADPEKQGQEGATANATTLQSEKT